MNTGCMPGQIGMPKRFTHFDDRGCSRLTSLRNKNKRNNPECPFDLLAIPIPENMKRIPSIVLWGTEYSE